MSKIIKYLKAIGPGVTTGASDNDPAGISTYSITGANTGFTYLWLAVLSFPLMIAVQDMSARIGAIREEGLGLTIQRIFGRRWFAIVLATLTITNVATIGADLAGISAALQLLTGLNLRWFIIPSALLVLYVQIFWSYHKFAKYLKFLTLILFTYIIAAFLAKPDWTKVLHHTFTPHISWDAASLSIVVGMLGTTISPYLFFWQASQEIEEIREENTQPVKDTDESVKKESWRLVDTTIGMFYSALIAYFIILTSGTTLHNKNVVIETAADAAEALRPVAGEYAYILFSIGIAGAGLLAIPVLAGATAYPMAEWFGCPEGLDRSIIRAKCFYFTIAISVIIGVVIAMLPISPIRSLFYSQVLMGLLTPIILIFVILIARNKEIMGEGNANTPFMNIFGWLTIFIMTLVNAGMLWTLVR